MKTITKLLCVSLLCITIAQALDLDDDDSFSNHPTIGRSFFEPRSQLADLGRNFSGLAHLIFLDTCSFNWQFNVVPEYSTSSSGNKIGTYLFFNGANAMLFASNTDPQTDVFAQNFLLNDQFKGTAEVEPRVSNALVTFDLYLGLDNVTRGLYFRVLTQAGQTRWNAKLEDGDNTNPGTFIAANALGNSTDTPAPYTSITAAWNGDLPFFDVKQPLQYARLNGSQKHSGLTNIECIFGYNVVKSDCYYFGFNICAIIPTGNAPTGKYLFEPVLGNGNHFQLGGGVTWHRQIWTHHCHKLDCYIQGNVYHIFNATQHRTFDLLRNGIGSRYLLFKKFDGSGNYTGEIVRGPNILTLKAHVKNNIEGQAMFMLDYQHGGFTVDVGYNLWGRTNDRITLLEEIPSRIYGIAGTTGTGAGANETASLTTISGEHANEPDAVNQYIATVDLDLKSAEHPGCFSHSFFGHLGYVWEGCHASPFIGIGGQIEFPDKTDTALKLVHIWGKIGVAF